MHIYTSSLLGICLFKFVFVFIIFLLHMYVCTPELMEIGNLKTFVSAFNKARLFFIFDIIVLWLFKNVPLFLDVSINCLEANE